jgi:hypothetical protein
MRRCLLSLAAILASLAAPSLASALVPPACPSSDQEPSCIAEWQRYFAEADNEAAERKAARENASVMPPSMGSAAPAPEGSPEDAAALAKAEREPVTAIFATVKSHPRRDPTEPGSSEILISTSPNASAATVAVTLKRGRAPRFKARGHIVEVAWPPCDVAGMSDGFVVKYTIRARPRAGGTAWTVRSGRLSVGSRKRCTWLNERAGRESARRIHAEERREARERAEERAALGRWEGNCRAEGGTVVILHTAEGSEYGCKAPNGGLLHVPE